MTRWKSARKFGTVLKNRIVILSTADFDSPIWTNKQHLAAGLAEMHDVVYIESLGLRAPTFAKEDLTRILKKVGGYIRRKPSIFQEPSKRSTGPKIISPFVLPFHRFSLIRGINKILLHRQMSGIADGPLKSTLWTFSPLTYGLEEHFDQVVYHSVDLLHTLPKVPSRALLAAERSLVAKANHVIASSSGVKEHLENIGGAEVTLWENVAHVEKFTRAAGIPRKNQAVFAGNLTPSKIDIDCLNGILATGVNLALAGPMDIDGAGGSTAFSALIKHPQVTYHGNLDLDELANLLAESKVGLIPYQINEYTSGVFPMKVYEYLAAGLSVVSTRLPSLSKIADQNVQIVDPGLFAVRVKELIEKHDIATAEASIADSKNHSWSGRIAAASNLLLGD